MPNITHEQFMKWCEYWNYTEEEGYKAMCFVANVIGQNYSNHVNHVKEVSHEGNHSEVFKVLAETNKDDAYLLLHLYGDLDREIYNMLEEQIK